MEVRRASTDAEIAGCFAVMAGLRPDLQEAGFVARVRELAETGYMLAYGLDDTRVVVVAGFRMGDSLARGPFLYVDDLVTAPDVRSRGYGAAMLAWLREFARSRGCGRLHLDSGLQRVDAHRFYEREGMRRSAFHFFEPLHPADTQA